MPGLEHAAVPAPTLQQIATAAGVSKASVSMALRDDPRIKASRRSHIRAVAEQLGYRPNPLLAIHMAHLRSQGHVGWQATLAYLVHENATEWSAQPNRPVNLCYVGAKARAESLGFTLDLLFLDKLGSSPEGASRVLASRGIPGVILGPWPASGRGETIGLDWTELAAATVGYSLKAPGMHRACHDNFSTMGRAIAELSARGYQRIGFVSDPADEERVNHLWLAGFLSYQATLPLERRLPALTERPLNEPDFLNWTDSHRPDAIITTQAGRVLGWLREAGIVAPANLGVLDLHWRKEQPECAGFDQNFEELGASAVELVVAQLHRNERGLPAMPKVMLLPGAWREGATLRPREAGAKAPD